MRIRSAQPRRLWGAVVVCALASAGCGDDTVLPTTETASESGTGTSSTGDTGDTVDPTTSTLPTTTTLPTTSTTDETTDTGTTTEAITSSTTEAVTTGTGTDTNTTTDTDTGTGTDSDTDTDTDGREVVGKTQSQFVNAGRVSSSANFRMVYTLGQPTTNQGTYTSPNFRLQGGLIGANGSPP